MIMKKTLSTLLGVSTLFASFAFAFVLPVQAAEPNWDTSGDYVISMEYQGDDILHDVTLVQDTLGDLNGDGGSPAGANTYLWTITDGTVDQDAITFTADYTATADAVTPQTTLVVDGTVASDGTMSGTWSDNYNGESRSGTWDTVSGTATAYPTPTVTVTIEKFVQGAPATAETANNADFPMTASYDAENTGAGSGDFALSDTNTIPYQAMTAEMTAGANYQTEEILTGEIVAEQCSAGTPFALEGYTTGDTRAEAMAATPTTTAPSFTNMQNDAYVIVWNDDCAIPEGEINGDVVPEDGVLEVTSIEMVDTTANANGSFADGWKYVFNVTIPDSEPNVAMKFSNWMQTDGTGTIAVANNMRISSLQADNGGATILLTAADLYSSPDLHMTGDLDSEMAGRQVEITVEVAVPSGTPNGSYTTSYGVRSNQ